MHDLVPPLALSEGFHVGGLYVAGLVGLGITLVVGVGALSNQHERAFSASVFYVLLGVVGALALSVLDVTPLDPVRDHTLLERLAELALIVAVFAAGLTVEANIRRRSVVSVLVLLAVVMPLTIAIIALFGYYAMGLSFGAAVILGSVLAPTDPVLAGDVGLGPPGSIEQGEPQFSLHTEAGLNDGLASPFVLLGLLIAQQGGTSWLGEWLWADLLYAVCFAIGIGLLLGWGAAWVATRARSRGLINAELDAFAALALVLVVYGLSEFLGSYGLLAVFAAGFAFRRYEYGHEVHEGFHLGSETASNLLELLVLLLLGSMLTIDGLGVPGWSGWLLAPLLIFVIRPVLVLATSSPGLAPLRERVFLGFFGVRGVAALFYAAIVVESGALSSAETDLVVWTTLVCVVVSIVIHGISLTPLQRLLLDEVPDLNAEDEGAGS
ncbi:MAG: cation:proton antiporter [Solirubrobacterales bacterium]|nr:cation:proton antiporter [Solirubrobacterales bacterium]